MLTSKELQLHQRSAIGQSASDLVRTYGTTSETAGGWVASTTIFNIFGAIKTLMVLNGRGMFWQCFAPRIDPKIQSCMFFSFMYTV